MAQNKFDSFAYDIKLGGLRDMLDIKIIICYIISAVKVPVTRQQLLDSLTGLRLVNYFDANHALNELVEDGVILETESGDAFLLAISDEGRRNAKEIEYRILPGVRRRAVAETLRIISRATYEKENRVDIVETEDSYDVTFVIGANEQPPLLSLTLNIPDKLQAEQLKENFLDSPADLYNIVVDELSKTKR